MQIYNYKIMNKKSRKNSLIIIILILVFIPYNFFIYTSKSSKNDIKLTTKTLKGQKLWQDNNCWSCHQIYGLGGFLGPDLTNIYSNPLKGKNYIKVFINSGVKSMPKYNFSEDEKDAIIAYLQQIDSSGTFPDKNITIKQNGWVELNYKNERK